MKNFPLYRFLICAILLLIAGATHATTYYVSTNGDDTNSGLSWPEAFATIQAAADIMVAGDLVLVANGTYVGFDFRNVDGTAANPITFQADGNSVLINTSGPIRDDGINIENADWVIVDGFIVNDMTGSGNGVRVVTSNNCIVRNCACDNNAERGIFTGFTDDILIENNLCTNAVNEHGIYVSNSSDRPIIRYNECHDNNNIGIHLNGDLSVGGDGIISDAEIYGNLLYNNNFAAGINMDGVENPLVYNNLIYNNHSAQGIALFQQDGAIPTQGAKIYNNTIIVPTDGRWGILVLDGSNVDTEIYNNIILNFHAWRGCIAIENQTDFISDYNIVHDKMSNAGDGSTITFAAWQALGLGPNSMLADPIDQIFTDPANDVYTLLSNSQAVDAGTNAVSSIVSDDIDGNTRPQGNGYDIGAYEYSIPVSVELLDPVRAKLIHGEVWLTWSTATELNSSHFEIDKSPDGRNWYKIEEMPAHGTSLQTNYYRMQDPHTAPGQSYYRVTEVEYSGQRSVLGIVGISVKEMPAINVFPNPGGEVLVLQHELNVGDIREVALWTLTGELVKRYDTDSSVLEVGEIPGGTYILQVLLHQGADQAVTARPVWEQRVVLRGR